tara:strand:+ start:1936 stop:2352 length:417 start_codon:yes stop_codon:yes gene_type:complete
MISNKPKFIKLKKFKNLHGSLFAINSLTQNEFPFEIKRIFFVKATKNSIRGNHAHIHCSQLLICLNGKIEVTTFDRNLKKMKFTLDDKSGKALLLPVLNWIKYEFLHKDNLLAVVSDFKYDRKKDYISNFKKFTKFKS